MDDTFIRPDPDELLSHTEEETQAARKGKLKIFFGYSAGVGKTYTMLQAAHIDKAKGMDVIVGYIEPHTRAETMALLEGLSVLPVKKITYRNIELSEFDLDAALARLPQLILVDELAHTNAPGVRNKKRYQDIEELLNAGIDVYTTINVQHLESLNDVIEDSTKIPVHETVPDYIFDESDKVELVDIEPEELLKRFSEGKIYRPDRAATAMNNFFTPDNLDFLREISMRRSADRIYRDTISKSSINEKKHGATKILVLVGPSPSSAKNIRVASRMAEAFHGLWTAAYVETSRATRENEKQKKSLRHNINLAEQLGAETVVLTGEDIAGTISNYAKITDVTNIVIGKTRRRRRFSDLFREDFEDRLISLLPGVEVHIIPDNLNKKTYNPATNTVKKQTPVCAASDIIKTAAVNTVLIAVFITAAVTGFSTYGAAAVYILAAVLVCRITGGHIYSLITCTIGLLCMYGTYRYYDIDFSIQELELWFQPLYFTAAAFGAGGMVAGIKRQVAHIAVREQRTQILYEINKKLLAAGELEEIVDIINRYVSGIFGRSVIFYTQDPFEGAEGIVQTSSAEEDSGIVMLSPDEQAVAHWVFINQKRAGAGTDTLMGAGLFYTPVMARDTVLGVMGITCASGTLSEDERLFLQMIISQTAMAVERQYLSDYSSAKR